MADEPVTQYLQAFRDGDPSAFDRIVPALYQDLKRMAAGQLRRGGAADTLGPTGLVHELYLKMMGQQGLQARDRCHFLAISAHAMRQVLADGARRRLAAKRGGGELPLSFDDELAMADEDASWLGDLDGALERLAEVDQRLARVVECRFFGGMSEQETATALDLSLRTAQRDWMRARAWLKEDLGAAPEVDDA